MIGKAAYLDTRNTSYGFEPTAIVHSIPQALFMWAFFLFAIQGFWMAFADLPQRILFPTIISVAIVLGLVCTAVWVVLNPREKTYGPGDSEASLPASVPLEISIDEKGLPMVDGMV
jgi:hypothetical protein